MSIARFRFYGRLNDLLAPGQRGRAFDAPYAEAATVKHAIETLGVPHTEVDLILVNEDSVSFARRLDEGDRVAVYPPFMSLDVSLVSHVRPEPLPQIRFLADAHLGGLARLLRMAGFDTLYDNNYQDDAIEATAIAQHRVVLSRDRELLKRGALTYGCYVYATEPAQQLREVVERYGLADKARPFSLCLSCNAPLRMIDKQEALARIPPRVQSTHHEFSTCDLCRRVYWQGSHWQRMRAMLDSICLHEPDKPQKH